MKPAVQLAKHAKATSHPIGINVLRALKDGELSPNRFATANDEQLGVVSYHFQTLLKAGWLELAKTEPRRGAVEHYYRLTPDGCALLEALEAG